MLLSAAAAASIAATLITFSPAAPPGYTYEGIYRNMNACVARAAVLDENYGIRGFSCEISTSTHVPERELWVLW